MSVPALVVLVVLAAIVLEDASRPRARRSGPAWYAGWALAGFASLFSAVSLALGLLVLPVAVVALVGLSRVSGWPDSLGFVAGVGAGMSLVGALNVGEPHASAYVSWLLVGGATAAGATALYALAAARAK